MEKIRFISFDLDGTLTTMRFSDLIWNEEIPKLYAQKKGMDLEEAKRYIKSEYDKVGEGRLEWYDIKYWFNKFGLEDHRKLLNDYKNRINYYPEVEEVLERLSQRYKLVLASNAAREFINIEIERLAHYFTYTLSALEFGEVKKSENFYLQLCHALKIDPQKLIHIGDHWEFDFLVPRRIGITSFFIDRNEEKRGEFIVRDLKEFERKLNKTNI